MDNNYCQAIKYTGQRLRCLLSKFNGSNIQEIRLRVGRPLSLTEMGKEFFIDENAQKSYSSKTGIIVTNYDIEDAFRSVTEYSVHSFAKEMKDGYITIEGGHRVGLCGTAVCKNGIETIKHISGMNFRIAREYKGSADKICSDIFCNDIQGTLIIGPPSSAKTTILRDLCRQLGTRYKISLIDERSEIAASHHGIPQNDIGTFTDVFDGYPKKDGILTALRVMSPQIIMIDELGSYEDCEAVEQCMHCGVSMIATAHAATVEEIKKRTRIWNLCMNGVFNKIVLLGVKEKIGQIIGIYEVNEIAEAYRYSCNNAF